MAATRAERGATLLEVREGNVGGRRLYSRLGFAEVGLRKKYYPDGESAVLCMREAEGGLVVPALHPPPV